MDVLGTARAYIKEMVNLAGPQMKVILMDKETTTIVSCAFAQSEMMQKEVREVHEFFVDGIALSAPLFTVNLKHIYDQTFNVTASSFLRIKQALVALLLSQKKKPLIRYQRSSEDCKRLAEDLNQVMRREEGLFDNAKRDAVLLIVDRSEDPVTPLLNQWTYEAMVHELITINNNRVTVDGQSMVLSELHDEFYAKVEQSIVAEGDHSRCLERVRSLINHPKTTRMNALRLVLLYALRFEGNPNNELSSLVGMLRKDNDAAKVVRALLRYGGAARRKSDLFGEGSTMGMTKRFIKGLKGVENIYTQHEPYLKDIVENTVKGRLSEQQYPYVSGDVTGGRQENLIVFIVGGATFEEALFVRSQNEKRMQGGGGPAITLATTFMHNTTSFIEQFSQPQWSR
ncbi:Sec1 family protein [Teladorsagia circumcincta]|uniref:Sec1 family protein n=1 Tax=Teladorsagia circumcincta TaxID=45464 RepID=A0A2G9V7I8_TELCI|nr:Sec1 family protein [Teladorsagia circumcincta]